jgi:hypothetical protein
MAESANRNKAWKELRKREVRISPGLAPRENKRRHFRAKFPASGNPSGENAKETEAIEVVFALSPFRDFVQELVCSLTKPSTYARHAGR